MCEALCTRGWLYTGDEPADGPSETSGYRQARQESGFHGNVPHSCSETRKNSFMIISMKFSFWGGCLFVFELCLGGFSQTRL